MSTKIQKLIKLWLPVGIWCAVIFAFSSMPQDKVPQFYLWNFIIKKTAHFVEYAVLATLVVRAMYQTKRFLENMTMIKYRATLFCLIYAFSDEIHQRFVPGRTATLRDVIIDFVGTLTAIWLVNKILDSKKLPLVKKIIYGK